MVIVATDISGRANPLPSAQLVSVPVTGHVSIKPGEELVGDVNLSYYAQGISDLISRQDVLVFWWYELRTDDVSLRSSYHGALVLSAQPGR